MFSAIAESVYLDVFVTRDGAPVRGLQADDFVYRGKALRHFVAFALERLALE